MDTNTINDAEPAFKRVYRKNELVTVPIDSIAYPDLGVSARNGHSLRIKGTLPGQLVTARVTKRRGDYAAARLIDVIEKAPYETEPACRHFGLCGGCCFQSIPYGKQLELKEAMVLSLFEASNIPIKGYRGIYGSPEIYGYRNKMEFSFGDTGPGGELSLGMRRKNSWYEVIHVSDCKLVSNDMRVILNKTLRYFREHGTPFYSTRRREGVLRHLVVRESKRYGSLLVNLVTTPEIDAGLINGFRDAMLSAGLSGTLAGVLHTVNASVSDTVKLDDMRLLYGKSHFCERVLGLDFKITPASFFQTNTLGAELLYSTALELAGDCKLAYDLYCGTGTITQLISRRAKKAVGIEIIPDAVSSARASAEMNGIQNAEFICGDVLEAVSAAGERPDVIVADPPREGIHPKALRKIAGFDAGRIIYISCKPTSLVRDLSILAGLGYEASDCAIIDMFPGCAHVETVVLLSGKRRSAPKPQQTRKNPSV